MRKLLYARRVAVHKSGAAAGAALVRCVAEILDGLVGARTVGAFLPIRTEIETRPLIKWIHEGGGTVVLPTIAENDPDLIFRVWAPGDPTSQGAFGVPEPRADAPVLDPDLLIVPVLAFDRKGFRLGYGGGYYDRAITRLSKTGEIMTIGVAFDEQEVVHVPREPHDRRLSYIATPTRTFRLIG